MSRTSERVTVQQVVNYVPKFNRISGHRWSEQLPVNRWEVSGPYGSIMKCHTEDKARKVAEEYQTFYDKFPQPPQHRTG